MKQTSKPNPENSGWEESHKYSKYGTWTIKGGEKAYYKALKKWEENKYYPKNIDGDFYEKCKLKECYIGSNKCLRCEHMIDSGIGRGEDWIKCKQLKKAL